MPQGHQQQGAAAAMWEPLSADQVQALHAELGATEDTLRRDVATMRQWMAMQPHLPQLDGEYQPSSPFVLQGTFLQDTLRAVTRPAETIFARALPCGSGSPGFVYVLRLSPLQVP